MGVEEQVRQLSEEIELLHSTLEAKGENSRRVKGLDGNVFDVPVDAEHKATQLKLASIAQPHMRAFHASWFAFFSTFFSTFAPAPLAKTLTKPNTLNLTRADLYLGNILSVTSNIICRFLMGIVCDKLGARRGLAFVMLFTCPFILGLAFVQDAAGFVTCRFFIGMGLASFVACQVWCTQQFSKNVVGVANATAGGWGNLGGGITTLLIPQFFLAFMSATNGNENLSWRLCMIVPLTLHLVSAAFALSGRDLPDGNYGELEKQGSKQKSRGDIVTKVGCSNVNAWILTLTYGFCFGVELTVTNVAVQYFQEFFALSQAAAGLFGSIFGLCNLLFRSLGGILSDGADRRFGMRGRIWALFIIQMLEGVVCILLGSMTTTFSAPDFSGPQNVVGWAQIAGWVQPTASNWVQVAGVEPVWVPYNGSCIDTRINSCGTIEMQITDAHRACLDSRFAGLTKVVLSEPPAPWGNGDLCVSNSGRLGGVVAILFVFSLCVQMSEGLTYGVVPYVSRPALGVVSGMVGAGGNAGALITNALFFSSDIRSDLGFVYMGIAILGVTSLLLFVYFPDMGSMLTRAGALRYDPQLIKPPKGYRGADSMNYGNVDKAVTAKVGREDLEATMDNAARA